MNAEESKLPEGAGKPQNAESQLVIRAAPGYLARLDAVAGRSSSCWSPSSSRSSASSTAFMPARSSSTTPTPCLRRRCRSRSRCSRRARLKSYCPATCRPSPWRRSTRGPPATSKPGTTTSARTCTKANCLQRSRLRNSTSSSRRPRRTWPPRRATRHWPR